MVRALAGRNVHEDGDDGVIGVNAFIHVDSPSSRSTLVPLRPPTAARCGAFGSTHRGDLSLYRASLSRCARPVLISGAEFQGAAPASGPSTS